MIKTMRRQAAFSTKNVLLAAVLCCPISAALFAAATVEDRAISVHPYEDDRIRVAVPAGWTTKRVTETTTGDQRSEIYFGGVLSRGKYRLYLLTHYSQASGIDGGRFGEISEYVSPWMKVDDPWGCFNTLVPTDTPVTSLLSRVDLFFDSMPVSSQESDDCKHLHSPVNAPVWFGSYFSPNSARVLNGFFLTFPLGKSEINGPDDEMVFTATIDTHNPETLPAKGDRELSEFLREASAIVSSIQYKR